MASSEGPRSTVLPSSRLSTTCAACLDGPENLSHRIMSALNAADYTHPVLSHISPDVRMTHNLLDATNRKELLDSHRHIKLMYPGYHVQIMDSSAEVDHAKGTAKIWLLLEIKGVPEHGRRESVMLLHWRISGGEWTHYLNRGLTHGGGGD